MNAIEQVRQAEQAARLKAAADFRRLAELLAAGDAAPADAVAVLTAAGKTTNDLEAAVNLATERRELQPLADAFQKIVADKATAEAELRSVEADCSAERAKLEADHLARINPQRVRLADLAEAERQSRAAKTRLQSLAARPNDARRFTPTVEVGEG
jgi:aspartokinase